ncbi:hypothetical protein LY78DRAFT_174581 [Colletotrichum sublineola]|nr:hypothetical protein LY78DRAFT_174581 [Colletotrichum sublineola]
MFACFFFFFSSLGLKRFDQIQKKGMSPVTCFLPNSRCPPSVPSPPPFPRLPTPSPAPACTARQRQQSYLPKCTATMLEPTPLPFPFLPFPPSPAFRPRFLGPLVARLD